MVEAEYEWKEEQEGKAGEEVTRGSEGQAGEVLTKGRERNVREERK